MKKTRLVFDKQALFKELYDRLAKEQTDNLIVYAMQKIQEIGNVIASYHSAHNMDRTGNLLDSLCWGVSYEGQLVQGGFYREKKAYTTSGLHEWSYAEWDDAKSGMKNIKQTASEEVDGHALAEAYLQKYGNNGAKGWKVFFAILAPYWGYWEQGFKMKSHFGRGGSKVLQFAVMTQFYDQIRKDLKPARTRFRVSIAKYTSISLYKRARKTHYGR